MELEIGKPHVFIDTQLEKPELIDLKDAQVVYYVDRCPGKEGTNGDAFGIVQVSEAEVILMLADGAGGTPGGNEASGISIDKMLDNVLFKDRRKMKMRNLILDGFEEANELLLSNRTGAGTTLFVVEINSDCVRPYYVGDSEIILTGQKGKLKYQTIPHSPVGYAVEAGLMSENQAKSELSKTVVFNLVGDAEMRIELGPKMKMDRFDTLFIGSDGVTDNLKTDELVEIIRKGPLLSAAEELVSVLKKKMNDSTSKNAKPDDVSFILYRLNESN